MIWSWASTWCHNEIKLLGEGKCFLHVEEVRLVIFQGLATVEYFWIFPEAAAIIPPTLRHLAMGICHSSIIRRNLFSSDPFWLWTAPMTCFDQKNLVEVMTLYDFQVKALTYLAISVFTFLKQPPCHVRTAQCSLVNDKWPYGEATWRTKAPRSKPVRRPHTGRWSHLESPSPSGAASTNIIWNRERLSPRSPVQIPDPQSLAIVCLVIFLSHWVLEQVVIQR